MYIGLLSACGLGITGDEDENNLNINTPANITTESREKKFKLGGQTIGLKGTLVLRNGDQQRIELNKNGSFFFAGNMTSGDDFAIDIESKPQEQRCELQNANGIISGSNVTSVVIICFNETVTTPLIVKGNASGLAESITLTAANGSTFFISQNGEFEFQFSPTEQLTPLTITEQSAQQICEIQNLSAIDASTTQVSFEIACEDIVVMDFAISVQVTGLLTLRSISLNNNETLPVNAPGVYEFNTRLKPQENYNVVLSTNQNPVQTCELVNANGQITNSDILIPLQCGPKFESQLDVKVLPWDGQVQVSWNDLGAEQYILHYAPNRDLNTTNSIPLDGFSINNAESPIVIENLPNNALAFFIIEAVFPGTDSLTQKVNARPNEIALDGSVTALTVADDGRVYVGGAFEHYSLRIGNFSGLRIDATTPADFIPIIAPNLDGGTITAIIKDDQGGYFIAGGFTSIDGIPRKALARLHADGALDAQWQPEINGSVSSLAYYNNVLYVGGLFTQINGEDREYLGALDANAELTDFTPEVTGRINHFAQNGNELYIAGFFTPVGQPNYNYVSMISLDNSKSVWTHSFENYVWDISYANNSIFVAGAFRTDQGNLQHLTAFNAEGVYQTNFTPNITGGAITALASDGSNLYIAGIFNNINQQQRSGMAAFDANNQLLPWAPVINDSVRSLAVSNNGDIYIAGKFSSINQNTRFKLAAVDNNSGTLLDWNPDLVSIGGVFAEIRQITIIDNLLFITSNSNLGLMKQAIPHLAAFESDGELANWNPAITLGNKENPVTSFNIDNDTIYVAGDFREINGKPRTHLAAITSAGELIDDFAPAVTNNEGFSAISSVVLHNSELYIAGKFLHINDVERINLAAIDLNGVLTDWNPSGKPDTYQLATNFSDELDVAGTFSSIAGLERHQIARFNNNGELDLDFVPMPATLILPWTTIDATSIDAIAIASDNSRYVAYSDGPSAYNTVIAELDNAGNIAWQVPRSTGQIQQLLVDSNAIYTAGSFTWQTIGVTHEIVAAISRTDPSELLDWNPKLIPAPSPDTEIIKVNAMAAYGQVIYLGGRFATTNGVNSIHLAAVDKNTGETQKWPRYPPPW